MKTTGKGTSSFINLAGLREVSDRGPRKSKTKQPNPCLGWFRMLTKNAGWLM